MPEVSVIMPVYNKAKYLADALEAVMLQTYSDFELIIIDDGSSDASFQIACDYAKKDKRFRVFSIENQGVSHARNLGMSYAKGKYITFIDADDTIHALFIENMYSCLITSHADMVISGIVKHRDGVARGEMTCGRVGLFALDDLLKDFASVQKRCGVFGSCVAKLFSRELAQGIQFDEKLKLAEDFDFYLQLYAKAETVYCDDKLYYFYLQETENSSVQVRDDQIDYVNQLHISLKYCDFLSSKNAYLGENKRIVDEQITVFFYLSLFYCPKECFAVRFGELQSVYQMRKLTLAPQGMRQKMVLKLFQWNLKELLYCVIYGYRGLRSLVRRI